MISWAPVYEKLGSHLAKVRKERGFTQAEAGRACGPVTPQFVSNIERGAAAVPTYILGKWIKLYRLDPDQLLNFILKEVETQLRNDLMR